MSQAEQNYLFTSESVTEGHPDKVCDQISDSVLDAAIKGDPRSRVACESMVKDQSVYVMGEITTKSKPDINALVRETVRKIGYTDPKCGFSADECQITVNLSAQSADIDMGVVTGGAGDQGLMFGYASDETEELMPLPIMMAHKLCQRLAEVRRKNVLSFVRPDGKSQVTVAYENGEPKRVDAVVVSTQHTEEVTLDTLTEGVRECVIKPVIPAHMMDKNTKFHINPTGRFVTGGPAGDSGLTGRKIIVDTYG
ncbi:MAG: methionine adenosyltransferase, partial [Terriglobia bacterium]